MEYDFDIYALSKQFYTDYPKAVYPELMCKDARPYICLLIDSHEGYFICVPFRSNIQHNQAFLFRGTKRSMQSRSGLDYKKSVIISDLRYIDSINAVVDADEYNMVMQNAEMIAQKICKYIADYKCHVNGTSILHQREFNRRYRFSTLPYFHDVLGIQ